MSNQIDEKELRRYALLGAQARLVQIEKEAAAIYRTFPQLRERGGASGERQAGDQSRSARADSDGSPSRVTPSATRRQRTMNAAQRKAVGERMRKYWAARRDASGASARTRREKTAAPARAKAGSPARGAKRPSRKMSAAGRKRISEAQKARWAKQKSGTPAA